MPKTEHLKIPLDRVGPLIGTKGEVKKEIERLTGTSLFVNSDDGTVSISADENMNNKIIWGLLNFLFSFFLFSF